MSNDTLTLDSITYERHAFSSVFPLMSAEDYALLLDSMRSSGQLVSIKLIDTNFVFDGWNRLRACVELNIRPAFEHIASDQDLQALAIGLNLAHRHLTAGQKGLIAGQLATLTHGGTRPGAGRWHVKGSSNDAPPQTGSIDEQAVHDPGADPSSTIERPAQIEKYQDLKLDLDTSSDELAPEIDALHDGENEAPEPVDANGKSTIKAAAERMGISRATAAMGKRVAEDGDESLLDAVKAGDISLADGYIIAKSPREEQRDHVKRALENGKEWLKTHKQPREQAEKIAKSVLKGGELPEDMTDAQIAAVFVRVADAIVVGTLAGATCSDAHSTHFTQSHITQFTAAYQRFGEALAKRSATAAVAKQSEGKFAL